MTARALVHRMKERQGRDVITRCGMTGPVDRIYASIWEIDVTCPDCLDVLKKPTGVLPSADGRPTLNT